MDIPRLEGIYLHRRQWRRIILYRVIFVGCYFLLFLLTQESQKCLSKNDKWGVVHQGCTANIWSKSSTDQRKGKWKPWCIRRPSMSKLLIGRGSALIAWMRQQPWARPFKRKKSLSPCWFFISLLGAMSSARNRWPLFAVFLFVGSLPTLCYWSQLRSLLQSFYLVHYFR